MAKEFWCDSKGPIVETEAGKVRGYRMDGIYTFLGIKYADAERFQAPKPVKPWEGVKDCFAFGSICPTFSTPIFQRDITHSYRYWPNNEHCQYLNVWTHNINNDVKKPVMVWIHGGGYTGGSAVEIKAYDMDGLVEYGDVVGVSLTHRLNVLGFLDLSAFGEEYAESANASIQDLVAALQWIKRNISKFGGDPDNVTIFGQSGGGGKVTTLLQTPAADGLYHKAIIESGNNMVVKGTPTKEDSVKLGCAVVEELGLTKETIAKIADVSYEELVAAWKRAARRLDAEGVNVDISPVEDGYFVGAPQKVGFTDWAKSVPMINGTNVAEFPQVTIPDKDALSKEDIRNYAIQLFGDGADEIIAAYAETYPEKHPADLLFLDFGERNACLKSMTMKKDGEHTAPIYNYLLTYDFQYNGGLPAWHSAELMLVFHKADTTPVTHEPIAQKLADQMASAWISFAYTGSPANNLLPEWPEFDPKDPATMCFDIQTKVKKGFDAKLMELCGKNGKARPAIKFYNR